MDNWLNWIGLAKKAGKLAPGHNQVQIALRDNTARLIIIAEDSGESVYRKYHLWAQSMGVPLLKLGSASELGRAMGMGPHAVLAILDKNIAARLTVQFGDPSGGINFDRKRKSAGIRTSQGSEAGQPEADRPASPPTRREHQESHEHRRAGGSADSAQHHGGKVASRGSHAVSRAKREPEAARTRADRGDSTTGK